MAMTQAREITQAGEIQQRQRQCFMNGIFFTNTTPYMRRSMCRHNPKSPTDNGQESPIIGVEVLALFRPALTG
jgi:hypothetical protein